MTTVFQHKHRSYDAFEEYPRAIQLNIDGVDIRDIGDRDIET